MIYIKSFDELRQLPNGSTVNKVSMGDIETFIIVGQIKQSKGLIVANKNSLADLRFIYERGFQQNTWVFGYDSKEVGKLMIQQIKEHAESEIEKITAVYLREKNNRKAE